MQTYLTGTTVELCLVLCPHPSLRLQAPPHGRVGRGVAGHRHGGLHGDPGQVRGDSRQKGEGSTRAEKPTSIRDSRFMIDT